MKSVGRRSNANSDTYREDAISRTSSTPLRLNNLHDGPDKEEPGWGDGNKQAPDGARGICPLDSVPVRMSWGWQFQASRPPAEESLTGGSAGFKKT